MENNTDIKKIIAKGFVFFNHFARLEAAVDKKVPTNWRQAVILFTYMGTAHFDCDSCCNSRRQSNDKFDYPGKEPPR